MIRIYEIYIPLVIELKKNTSDCIVKNICSKDCESSYFTYIDLHENTQLTRYSTGEVEIKSDEGAFTIYPEDFDRIEII